MTFFVLLIVLTAGCAIALRRMRPVSYTTIALRRLTTANELMIGAITQLGEASERAAQQMRGFAEAWHSR